MKILEANKIDLGKLADDLAKYENRWVAISTDNHVVGSGATYDEVVREAKTEVVLFKVPPLDASFAPLA